MVRQLLPMTRLESCASRPERQALLDNAVKYGGRGPVEIEIEVEAGGTAADPPAGRLCLTIADHGPGVAELDRGRLFARFARGTTQRAEDGSGLGLYVSREL